MCLRFASDEVRAVRPRAPRTKLGLDPTADRGDTKCLGNGPIVASPRSPSWPSSRDGRPAPLPDLARGKRRRPMSRPTRTFIALPVPGDRAEKLQRLQTLIAPSLPGARWVDRDKFHVTLAFLGDVPDEALNPLCLAVAEAVKPFPPLSLSIEGLGVFPDPTRPRVVWAGLRGDDLERVAAIQKAAAGAASGVGYPPEDDRFSPHVTLGRLKPGREAAGDCSPLLRHYERWRGGPLAVSEVVTFASQFLADGPAYVALGRAPLRGR